MASCLKKYYHASGWGCEIYFLKKKSEGKDTLWNISFRAFHEIQFQEHFMKHEMFLWNNFTLIFKFHCILFSSIKNCVCRKKVSCKISKIPKCIWMKPCLKTRSDKSACANIFLELLLTNSNITLEWMQHHTIDHVLTFIYWLLIFTFYITYTCIYDAAARAEFRSSRQWCF